MSYSENYLIWATETKHKPLTRSQYEFAEWVLAHCKDIDKIGEYKSVFCDIADFMKFSKNYKQPKKDIKYDNITLSTSRITMWCKCWSRILADIQTAKESTNSNTL